MKKHTIKALAAEGLGATEIGRRLGISRHAVRRELLKTSPSAEPSSLIDLLVNATKARPITLEEACDLLDVSPSRARGLVEEARRRGYVLDLHGHHVGRRPSAPSEDETQIKTASAKRIFAVCSDIHIGSRYHLGAQFRDFVELAYKRGARHIFVPGDILTGCYRHSRWEESHHGFDAQAEEAVRSFPRLRGLSYFGISGNHDETFEKDSGLDAGKALEDVFRRNGREDLVMLGARGALVRFGGEEERGVLIELWHPLKGPAYALSYKLQKKIEGYAVGQKPDFLFAGHWHQSVYFTSRGVHAFSAGTFQGGGGSFGKALGGAPSIGGWIVEYATTEEGTIRNVRPEWVAYYEHETPRRVLSA